MPIKNYTPFCKCGKNLGKVVLAADKILCEDCENEKKDKKSDSIEDSGASRGSIADFVKNAIQKKD